MITPPYLQHGDTVAIIATARKISPEEIQPSIDILNHFGFNVVVGKHLFSVDNQMAGNDQERASDFMEMLHNPDVKAIICARGGYGTARLFDYIDFKDILKYPKWLCGYSDVTALHLLYSKLGISSIHSTMPINFPKDGESSESAQSLIDALTGVFPSIHAEPSSLNIAGRCDGVLIGGNLSLLYAMQRTDAELDSRDKILFIEDLDEYLYHIDRMMLNLRQSGVLEKLKGIVVGYLSDMNDNLVPYGKQADEIVHEHCTNLGIPLAFGFPAGHKEPNLALAFGQAYSLQVDGSTSVLTKI
jgi:Uncharacterized proteins, homologs of microcin C7 resistance protein MccF